MIFQAGSERCTTCALLFFVRESRYVVEFIAFQLSDLFAALTRQRQELNDQAIGRRHLSCAHNDGGELLIVQNAITAEMLIV